MASERPSPDTRTTDSGIEIRPSTPPPTSRAGTRRPSWASRGSYPYTRGVHAEHVPPAAVDHAPVRRVRHGRGDQRAVQVPPGRRPDRPVVRLRPPHPDGLRLRPPPGRGRGGQGGGGHRLAGRHAAAAGRPPARQGHHLDDHQRHGGHPAAPLPAGGRGAGGPGREAGRHHPERHLEGVRGPGHLHLPAATLDAPDRRHLRLLRRAPAQLEHHLDLGLPHPRGRLDGGAGDRLHPGRRHRLRRGGASPPAWGSTTSRPGSPSSSTPTTTSSRRWPSTAPPGACGPAS